MSNVNCTQDLSAQLKSNPTVCAHVCVSVSDSAAARTHRRLSAMTRRRQGMPRSCSFHLMRQTPALIQSIYLGLTLICRDAACQTASGPPAIRQATSNCFSFGFSAVTTAVQRFSQSSSKRSAIHSRPCTRLL